MKKRNIGLLAVLLLLIGSFFVYKYLNQPHRDIATEKANFNITATNLIADFDKDSEAATQKYLNKTILVNGTVTATEENALTVEERVYAVFENKINNTQTQISIKGRCIGYDELLEEIKLDQCTIQN